MTTAGEQLTEVRQYIEDLEVGLTERLDALGVRLKAIERMLARIEARLPADGGRRRAKRACEDPDGGPARLCGGGLALPVKDAGHVQRMAGVGGVAAGQALLTCQVQPCATLSTDVRKIAFAFSVAVSA